MKNKAWIHYHIVTATPKDINGKQNVVQQTYLRMLLSSILSSFNWTNLSSSFPLSSRDLLSPKALCYYSQCSPCSLQKPPLFSLASFSRNLLCSDFSFRFSLQSLNIQLPPPQKKNSSKNISNGLPPDQPRTAASLHYPAAAILNGFQLFSAERNLHVSSFHWLTKPLAWYLINQS